MEVLDNGATVCSEHGLEVCGACGVDYRLLNSERGVSAPQPEPLSIKAKKLGASEDGLKDLDPSLLPAIVDTAPRAAWGGRGPLKQGFDRAFSMAEKQNSHLGIRPTVDADLTFHVRETLLAIAHCLEVEKCRTKMIQDKAQSLGICIVCLGAYEAGAADKQDHQDNEEGLPEKPIILLWYQCNSVTDPLFPEKMRSMSAGLAEGKRVGSAIQDEKQGMSTCETDRKEVEAIKILLDHNSKLLSKEWLAKNKPPPTFTASFVTPLKKKTMSHQPSEAVRTCVCGASNPKLRCSRCASVWYCSKACQVADWKAGHKRACRLPQDRAADEHTVIARVGRPDEVLEQAGARYLCTFSHHASSGDVQKQLKHPKDKVQRFDMFEPLSVPVGEGNVFISFSPGDFSALHEFAFALTGQCDQISKIQLPLLPGLPMMVYDKGKNFQTMIHPGNASQDGYARLWQLIQAGGQANGRKGYLSTALQAGGTELHIFASSLLPAQSW